MRDRWGNRPGLRSRSLLTAAVLIVCLAAPSAQPAQAAEGDLDTTFGGDGIVTTNVEGTINDQGHDVAVDAEGRVVVAGYSGPYPQARSYDILVTRYLADGALDQAWSGDGIVTVDLGGLEVGVAVAVDAAGRVVVVGYGGVQGDDIVVARFDDAGNPDPTFAGDGIATFPMTSDIDVVDVATSASSEIFVAGMHGNPSAVLIAKVLVGGTLDAGFDGDGLRHISFPGHGSVHRATGVAVAPTGEVIASATILTNLPGWDFGVARLTASGALDTSFSGDGVATADLGGDEAAHAGVALDGASIVLGGMHYPYDPDDFDADFAAARFTPQGSLDASFGGDGWAVVDFPTDQSDEAFDVAVDPLGRVVMAGSTSGGGVYKAAVTRLEPGGVPDTTFGGDGRSTVDLDSEGSGVAIDGMGRPVIAGWMNVAATGGHPSHYDVAVARFEGGSTSTESSTGWVWGDNKLGQLGVGAAAQASTPQVVPGLTGVVDVAAGRGVSIARRADGTLWSWGYNGHGLLGITDWRNQAVPVRVTGITGVAEVEIGSWFAVARKSDGTVWAWGVDSWGALGSSAVSGSTQTAVAVDNLSNVVDVAAGDGHGLAARADGTVWSWGYNGQGQLGDGTTVNSDVPKQVPGLSGVVAVGAGSHGSYAVTAGGTAFAWGHNSSGELGSSATTSSTSPVAVATAVSLARIDGGSSHAVGTTAAGGLYGWGSNSYGQVGRPGTWRYLSPVAVTAGAPVAAVTAGWAHTLARTTGGAVLAWGNNEFGQVGNGTFAQAGSPVALPGINDAVAVAAGTYHSLVARADGTVWAWGRNEYGELGNGVRAFATEPIRKAAPDMVDVEVGGTHTLALDPSGDVWAWGDNRYGALGVAGDGGTPAEVTSLSGVDVVGLSASYQSLAVDAGGVVRAWGANWYGQVGDGTTVSRAAPVVVTGLPPVESVATGYAHSMAVTASGEVWAWGDNSYGQLGDGTTTARRTPVRVIGLPPVRAVAGGGYHSLAISEAGEVWAWGNNGIGQVGDGTTANRSTPVRIAGPAGVVDVAAGGQHSVALDSEGRMWAWGYNGQGQLGDRTWTGRSTPVRVSTATGLTAPVDLDAGWSHTLARDASGRAWGWGSGSEGQLGQGWTGGSLEPLRVTGLRGVTDVSAGGDHSAAVAGAFFEGEDETMNTSIAPGFTVTMDLENDGATPSDPVETSVTSPVAGALRIEEVAVVDPPAEGFQLFGQQVTITAPTASAEAPLTIAVRLDASILPPGVTASNAVLFRNGTPVPACTGPPGTADPDPCITERLSLGDGDIRLTALTSRASDWTVGFATVRADAGGPYLVDEGSSVTLDGTRSSHPTGGPLSFRWAPDYLLSGPTSPTPVFTAVDDGELSVVLTTAAGGPGPDDTDTTQVHVRNVPPAVSAIVEPARRRAGEAATYTARFTDVGIADTHTVVWDWGDGTTSAGAVGSVKKATAATGTHTYAAKGRYTITLTITDDDGGVTSVSKTVTVA